MKRPYKTPLHEYVAEMQPELGLKLARQLIVKERRKLLPAVLNPDEALLCTLTGKTERNRLIVRVFYSTGVRLGEMANFLVVDIGWGDETMFVRQGKGAQDRVVCVDAGTLELLRAYTRKMDLNQSLFGICARQIENVVEECGEMLGLVERYHAMGRRFSPHAFRHSMATHAHENGMDLVDLQAALGHDHPETTAIYVHVSMERVRRSYQKAHPLSRAHQAPGMALKLQPGSQREPSLKHLAESYRKCHPLALQAST